ncbi:BgTH12-01378 [Blumeria graminis f. sp. triticale]|uniref:EKC/KEOPS complex subunit BUD32 n=1 Tax=Blumeria graminis f. sp. triticale TaxID=1689686 RepID=A0A9W4CYY9_BLUGR|nr:BgTH12-01378 [Blumeria graminis f. sp. triticale]
MEKYLAQHPLEQILDFFRDGYDANFYSNCETVFAKPKQSKKFLNHVRNLIKLFFDYIHRAQFLPDDTSNIESRLIKLSYRIESTPFDLAPFEPLASLILSNATDIEVWKSLLQLLDTLESILASQEEKEEKEKNIAAESVFRRAATTQARFWKKYFTNKTWEDHCIDLAKEFVKRSGEEDLKFPAHPKEKLVYNWMKAVETKIFDQSSKTCDISTSASSSKTGGDVHHITKSQFNTANAHEFDGGQTIRQVDYFIKRRGLPTSNRHHWRDVLVVGEFTESKTNVFMDKFLQLSILMRELFFAQPLRRFAHAFHLFDKSLLLWVYDRSGPYCGSYIDIGKSPQTLVYVMAAYMSMSDTELGLDPNIKYEAHQICVTLDVPGTEEQREFKLSPKPVAQQTSLVSRGTSCYHTLEGDCAVKFAWRMCGNKSEADLLKISDLRQGLIFTKKMVKDTLPDDTTMATPLALTDGIMLRESKSTSVAGSRKRKSAGSDSGTETGRSSKRSKSSYGSSYVRSTGTKGISTVSLNAIIEEDESSIPVAWVQNKTEGTNDANTASTGEKRKSTENDEVSGRIKRLHLSTAVGEASTVDSSGIGAVSGQDENASDIPFIAGEGDVEAETNNVEAYCEVEVKFAEIRDRHSSAVATIPYGRSLHEVESPLELVTVLRDAIKAHWSLMTDAKILHRDISANNIIMTGSEACKDWKGFVIDLDLAVLLTDGKSQEKRQAMTGTMEFMALEVLSGSCETTGAVVEHSYRHDLESFFYVLLWQCLSCGWEDGKNPNKEYLSKWYTGTAKEILKFKKGELKRSTFIEELLPRFSKKFLKVRHLAKEFRKTLFWPYGEFYIGSHKDNNVLYSASLKIFNEAIQALIS